MKYLILLPFIGTLSACHSASDNDPSGLGSINLAQENHDTLEISVLKREIRDYNLHNPELLQLIDEIGLCSEAVEDDWGVWLDQPAHINGSHYHCFATVEFASYYILDTDVVLVESNNLGNCGHDLSLWAQTEQEWGRVLQRCGVVDSVDININPSRVFFYQKNGYYELAWSSTEARYTSGPIDLP